MHRYLLSIVNMNSEENKVGLTNIEDLLEEAQENQSAFSFQNLFAMLVLNWQWFLLSLFIFVCGALLYLRYTESTYEMSARMLIKDDQSRRRGSTQMLDNMRDFGFLTNSSGLENEIEVLQSRLLIRDVVRDLKLYAEYRTKGRVMKPIVYGTQPVTVELDPAHLDSLDKSLIEGGQTSRFEITITRDDKYYLFDGVLYNGGKETRVLRKMSNLPASFKTSIGTVTLTAVAGREMEKGDVSLVKLVPPMEVATRYLSSMSVAPTSKLTDIALITLKDKNIQRGMDFLRHLAESYNRQANADKNEIALRTEEFINDRMSKIDAELGSTESAIESFKRQNAVTGLDDASESVRMSSQYSARLSEANSQIQMLDYLRDYVKNPNNKNQIIPSNVGLTDGASTRLIADYNQAVQDRNRLLQAVSEQAPQVQTLNATISELQAGIQTALLQARRSADISRQGIQSEYSKYQGRISSAPIQERVLTQIGRQQDVKSGLYLLLLQKREENSISLAATVDKGKLLDEPLFHGKVSPKTAIILLAALVVGLFLPMAVLLLLNFFRYKIEGHDDVARLTRLPIVADVAVASDSVKTAAGIVVQANKNNQIDEIFRSMRTNIQFLLKDDQKVILFTSSTAGEGKTFNAANLAVSFALLGRKVILCGLDIRKPALGRLFGISDRGTGITQLLTMSTVTPDALQKQICPSLVNENLDLLLAGSIPPNPAELLARDSFEQVITMLRERYDYVILDTAPVGLVTDTLQIGRVADVTVFVCRADYTPKSAFGLFNNLAQEKKMPNPCVVLNGVDMSKRKYGYYYGYGKYGRYGRYGYGHYGYGRYGYGNYGNYGNYGQYGRYAESHYGNKDDDSIKK